MTTSNEPTTANSSHPQSSADSSPLPMKRYRRWWLGKRLVAYRPFRSSQPIQLPQPLLIEAIGFSGPPSMTYGRAVLKLEGGQEIIFKGSGHRPNKRDVEVINVDPEPMG